MGCLFFDEGLTGISVVSDADSRRASYVGDSLHFEGTLVLRVATDGDGRFARGAGRYAGGFGGIGRNGCGCTHVERRAYFVGKFTARMARRLVDDARVMSFRQVADRAGVSCSTIMGLVRTATEWEEARRRRRPCWMLLIDETSIRRCQVCDGDSRV